MNAIRLYLLTIILLMATPAFTQQMYNRSGSSIGHYDKGRIYDRSGSYVGNMESSPQYSSTTSML